MSACPEDVEADAPHTGSRQDGLDRAEALQQFQLLLELIDI